MSHLKDRELKTTDLSLSDLTICSRDCFILEEICVTRSLNAIKAFSLCSVPCLRRFLTSFYYKILSWFVFPFSWQAKMSLQKIFCSLYVCHLLYCAQNCLLICAWKLVNFWVVQEGMQLSILFLAKFIFLPTWPPLCKATHSPLL